MRSGPFSLSCVVPAYNEAGNLANFLLALQEAVKPLASAFEIIVINDGSRDHTRQVVLDAAQELPLRYVGFSRNFGKEAALSAGLDRAQGDVVLLIDGDFQHPLELIPQMVEYWRQGYDMAYGVMVDRSNESVLKQLGTHFFYWLMTLGSNIKLPANAGDFRLMDRKVVDVLKTLPERNRFMKGLYAWVGFNSIALPFVPAERVSGRSSFNLRRLGGLALSGMTAFTVLPLRVWSLIGFVISVAAMLYGAFTAISTMIHGNAVPGWTTLAVSLMFFSGVQLLSIGILGEYLGRVYEEVKRRPLYVVAEDVQKNALPKVDA
jgi:glycosyltransferase involved in cell wall biosynthesis